MPLRVLLVDDEHAFLDFAREMLNADPRLFVVGEAASGEDALAQLGVLEPDVVVLDVNLPGMNGFSAAHEMHHRNPHVAIVMVSAFQESQFFVLARTAGTSGYISKRDLRPDLLVSVIEGRDRPDPPKGT